MNLVSNVLILQRATLTVYLNLKIDNHFIYNPEVTYMLSLLLLKSYLKKSTLKQSAETPFIKKSITYCI
jgi:hypothetical protein